MVHLLLEDINSKRSKILRDPKFAELLRYYNTGSFDSTTYTASQFLDLIITKFDPAQNVKQIPLAPGVPDTVEVKYSGDSPYIDFIINNLYSKNISFADANAVYDTLKAYRREAMRNTPGIDRNISSYKVFYQDESVRGRDGQPVPGLFKSMEQFTTPPNFTDNISDNFVKTDAAITQKGAEKVFATSEHTFYRIDSIGEGEKILGGRRQADFTTEGKDNYCSGYWCLYSNIANDYYPVWIAVDVYGFMDYAIVPKLHYAGSTPEIKNRYNKNTTSITMNDADYESLLKFFLEYAAQSAPAILDRFRGNSTFINDYNANFGGTNNRMTDFGTFLARSKNLETVNALMDKRYTSIAHFLLRFFFNTEDYDISENVFYQTMVFHAKFFRELFKHSPGAVKSFPLFASFGRMQNETDLNSTDLSYGAYSALATSSFIAKYQALKDITGDKIVLLTKYGDDLTYQILFNDVKKLILAYTTAGDETKQQLDDILNTLVDDINNGIITFSDERPDINQLVDLNSWMFFMTRKDFSDKSVASKKFCDTLLDSFKFFLIFENGLTTWTDKKAAVFNPETGVAINDMIKEYGQDLSLEMKMNIFKHVLETILNRLEGEGGPITAFNNITIDRRMMQSLDAINRFATILKIEKKYTFLAIIRVWEVILEKAVKDTEDKKYMYVCISVREAFRNGTFESLEYAKMIKAASPTLGALLANMYPKTIFRRINPDVAKYSLSRVYVAEQTQKFNHRSYMDASTIESEPIRLSDNAVPLNTPNISYVSTSCTPANLQRLITFLGLKFKNDAFEKFRFFLCYLIQHKKYEPQKIYITSRYQLVGGRADTFAQSVISGRESLDTGYNLSDIWIVGTDMNQKKIALNLSPVLALVSGGDNISCKNTEVFEDLYADALFERKAMGRFNLLSERVDS